MSATNKFRITTIIRKMLLANSNIAGRVGEKIYPLVAPKDTIGDFITYQRAEYTKNRNKMGVHGQDCFVYINAVSDGYGKSQDLACLIDECLDGEYTNPDGTPMSIWLEDSTEEFEDGKYIQILLYAIK